MPESRPSVSRVICVALPTRPITQHLLHRVLRSIGPYVKVVTSGDQPMYVTEEVSLVEFYESGLSLARDAGYEVVLCFVAREADAPDMYSEIIASWESLDDLTGPKILFLFAGKSVREIIQSQNIYVKPSGYSDEQGKLLFSPDVAMLPSKRMELAREEPAGYFITSHYDLKELRDNTNKQHPLSRRASPPEHRRFARYRPDRPKRNDIARAQTSQIRDLRNHLALRESDVPCFHLTFLDEGDALHYRLQAKDDVYTTLKVIVDTIEASDLKNLKADIKRINRQQTSVTAQLDALRKKSRSTEEVFIGVIASLRNETAQGNEGEKLVSALETALLDFTREPNGHRRRVAFDALRNARAVLQGRPIWPDLKSGVQRVIDLAPASHSFGDVSDIAAAINGFHQKKAATIADLEGQRRELEIQRSAAQRQLDKMVSPPGIRQRLRAALSEDVEPSLDTFVVIAARQEMDAVRSYLDSVGASRDPYRLSDNWSAERVQLENGRSLSFGLSQAPAQGVEDMAALLDFLQSKAKPKSILLVGMMAGIPGKSRLLDVQAPRNIVNGARLGTKGGRIVPEPHGRDVDPVMHHRLQSIDQGRRGIADIALVTHKHSICVAAKFDDLTPELAQAALLTDPENIVGIEMEGSALTARQATQRRSGENTGYLMIKGVADYAGEKPSVEEVVQLRPALEASGAADVDALLENPDPTTNKLLKSTLQKIATIRALRVALALIEEARN